MGWVVWSSAKELCKAPEGTGSSRWAEQPAPKRDVPELWGDTSAGDTAGLRHGASPGPRSPFEVLVNQMLVEILQLRLQKLHEWDDGLQREERGVREGTGGAYPAGHSKERGGVLLARASRAEGGPEGLPPTVRMWTGCAQSGPAANTGIKRSTWRFAPHCGVSQTPGMGQGEVGKGDGDLHQVGKDYSWLPETDGPGGTRPATYVLRLPGVIGR